MNENIPSEYELPLKIATYAVDSTRRLRLSALLTGGRLHLTVGSALDLFGGNLRLDDLVAACEQK